MNTTADTLKSSVRTRRYRLAVAAMVLSITVFHLLSLRPGHSLEYGDFAMYLRHAANLAQGRPYAESNYLYNPAYPSLGPRTYPPIFPLLLSPVYRLFDLNLMAFKVENVWLLSGFLLLLFPLLNELPRPERALAVAIIGLNPFVWFFKNMIYSDFAFLLFVAAALVAARKVLARESPGYLSFIGLGALFYAAAGTRTLGLLIPVAVVLHEWAIRRRPIRRLLLPLAVFVTLYAAQTLLLHHDSAYFDQAMPSLDSLRRNLLYYPKALCEIWFYGAEYNVLLEVLVPALGLCALLGAGLRWRRRPEACDLFALLYLAAILYWPDLQGPRFLLPLMPFFLLYAVTGASVVLPGKAGRGLAIGLILLPTAWYALVYARADFQPEPEGVAGPEARQLFGFLREQTPPDARIIFRKPRVLALFTDRPCAVYHQTDNPEDLLEYFSRIDASYVVASPFDERSAIKDLAEAHPNVFHKVFQNRDFTVYSFSNAPGAPP